MPTREQLETALINADKAGDEAAARALANAIKGGQFDAPQPQQAPPAFEVPASPAPASGAPASVAQPGPAGSQAGNIANPAARGLMFGFDDELVGALGAAYGTLMPESLGGLPDNVTFSDAYQGIRENVNRNREAFEERNPGTALAAELVGGLLTGGAGVVKGVKTLAPKAGNLGKTATGTLVGGTEGALYGAGTAEEGDRAEGALKNAAVGALLGGAGSFAANKVADKLAERAMLARKLRTGSASKELAPYKLDAAGKLKSDALAREAIGQGFTDGFVQQVKTAAPTDKRKMLKMVRMAKRALRDNRFASNNRINQVVGESLAKRVNLLNRTNREAADRLDIVAKNLKGQNVDYEPAVMKFVEDLQGLDIGVNTKGRVSVETAGSMIEGATEAEEALNRILRRMIDTGTPDAYDVHRLKRFIDNQVTYGKGQDKGLKGEVLGAVKKLRHNLDQTLDETFPEYNRVNTQYAETRGALDALQDAWGGKVNMYNSSAPKQLGIQSRKLLSNYAAGTNQLDAIENAEKVIQRYGGKVDDNIMDLVSAESALRAMMPQRLFNTFQGDIEKATGKMARFASGDRMGVMADLAKEGVDKMRGRGEEEALKALEQLLQESL